jgi:hypothetical protein
MYALIFSLILFFLLLFVSNTKSVTILEHVTNPDNNEQTPQTPQTYQPYTGNNPMILAEKNAANIEYLKEKLQDVQTLSQNFNSLQSKVDTNTENIKKMAQYATKQITQQTGITPSGPLPPAIAGLSNIKQ